jgi:hypothetical protein
VIGVRPTIVFCWLLAISPFLVFYSRVSRPYAIVVLLTFCAVLLAHQWLTSGRSAYACGYVAAGAAAVYFHLFAFIAVVVPLVCASLLRLCPIARAGGLGKVRASIVPSVRALVAAAAGIGAILCLLLLPAVVHAVHGSLLAPVRQGRFPLASAWSCACLFAGTARLPLVLCFLALLVVGSVRLVREATLLAYLCICCFPLYALVLGGVRPEGLQAAIVGMRYSMVLFPMSHLLVALGMDSVVCGLRAAGRGNRAWLHGSAAFQALLALFVAALFLAGPLPCLYAVPNNFTNHSAFQETYRPLPPDRSHASETRPGPQLRREDVPGFYLQLAAEPGPEIIIEYPMLLGDHFNLLYFYQRVHRRRVIVGYVPRVRVATPHADGYVRDTMCVDHVLSLVRQQDKLKFRNLVKMTDLAALMRTGATYVVLHRDPLAVFRTQRTEGTEGLYPPVRDLEHAYRLAWGPPAFEDAEVAVFRITRN